MRLAILKNGHSFFQKMQMKVIKAMMGQVPGPISVFSYNRDFFGKHYVKWLQHSMRKMKHWTVGEVELMAAYVSKSNECQYCVKDHTAVASNVYEVETVQAVLADLEAAPISTELKAMLSFIEKLTLQPSKLTKADVQPLLTAGLTKEAIEEAIHVCGVFNVVNRLADAFDFELSVDSNKAGRFLFKNGYDASSVWG